MFSQLSALEKEKKDCNIPRRFPDNPELGRWVKRQRDAYKTGELDPSRIERLEGLGIIWARHNSTWENMFAMLLDYKKEHGNCRVPQKYALQPKLGRWVEVQKASRKNGVLDNNRIKRLDEIGFDWDPFKARWEELFGELLAYRTEYGDCNVPQSYANNPKLCGWIAYQHAQYNSNKLSPDRIKRLEDIGFEWSRSGSSKGEE